MTSNVVAVQDNVHKNCLKRCLGSWSGKRSRVVTRNGNGLTDPETPKPQESFKVIFRRQPSEVKITLKFKAKNNLEYGRFALF